MKLSGPLAAGIVAIAVVVIIIAGFFYMRHATGSDVADQMHAVMDKTPPGKGPISDAQIEAIKRQRGVGGNFQPGGAR